MVRRRATGSLQCTGQASRARPHLWPRPFCPSHTAADVEGWRRAGRDANLTGRRWPPPLSTRAYTAGASMKARPIPLRAIPQEPTLSKYLLKLYVTGQTPRAERAIANLRRICEEDLGGQYELQIIDVLEHPQLAEDEKILATPTLIKRLPPPLRRVIGDLSDKDKVLLGLDVWPRMDSGGAEGE